MQIDRNSIGGVILAGGLSRRMGGGDKGLLDIAGKPMLAHVIERLAPQVGGMVINANGDPARFSAFELPIAADPVAGFVGPLAGVLAGMRWAAQEMPDTRHIVTVSADAPFVPPDLVARLAEALPDPRQSIALAQSADGLHPVIGLWPVALADDLETALNHGVRKVLDWTDRHGRVSVMFGPVTLSGQNVDPFFNANTPDELAEARRLLAG
jgi:molybdopterin-guanine dinucleotide biosynthesis protein A